MSRCRLVPILLAQCVWPTASLDAATHGLALQQQGGPTTNTKSIAPRDGWVVREDLQPKLPAAVVVREHHNPELRLCAWLVTAQSDGSWRPEGSRPEQGLRKTSAQAADLGALVAVNAGFFVASGSVSTVVDEGLLVVRGAGTVHRGQRAHPVTRAAIGFDDQGRVDCAWTWCFGDTVFAFDQPAPNEPGRPAPPPRQEQGRLWQVDELLGAGPMLVEQGKLRNTEVEECFQGIGRGSRHPRTAVGWTKDGSLLLLVVDGRSEHSRGATLEETAQILIEHGAEEALNFDGGGSSTLWVAGTVINRPSDPKGERPVASILALVPAQKTDSAR
jgi:hypothetical protein